MVNAQVNTKKCKIEGKIEKEEIHGEKIVNILNFYDTAIAT